MDLSRLSLLPAAQQEEILNGPALQPPLGILPNFEDPPNGNAITHFTIAICLVLTTAGFLLRTYSRIFRTGKFEIEDCRSMSSTTNHTIPQKGIFIGYVYCMYWVTSLHGFLIHQWDVKIINVGANLHSVTIMVIKTAILKEWSRIFVPHGTRNTFYWICHVVLWFNIIFYIAIIVGLNLACIPARGIWDKTIPAKCFDSKSMLIVAAAVNVVFNFIILLLPQRIIWHLQMSPKKKLGVSLIFTVGLLACISSIFRLEATIVHYRSEDAVYSVTVVALWALAEMACLLLVFFVPAIPKVISGNGVATRLAISIKSLPGIPSSKNTT
ncbi:hypothetical protein F4821DRAFT_271255 [Hypoxylon rubiginosum]|uniref:Uncharacterized protein n=1 Tax=Hypoxylon rubiginosum TaxID=110542 RepID=A0ACC0CV79_9PEZI|nr:hypothetical protein F4821DRAFT_271255 [Hypoxylon rubiginosum]